MKVKKIETRHVVLMLFSVLLACTLYDFTVHAADKIRVGCVDIGSFMQIDTDGCVTGYGAEYLNMIAAYTGWEYEYVKAPKNQCLDMLREGKLDLLFPAEHSRECAGDFLYSNYECFMDVVSLVGRKADSRFYYDDDKDFQGIRVGMLKGNDFNGLLEDYSRLHGFSYVPVYYETGAGMKEALNQERVDAMLSGSIGYSADQKLLAKIDYVPAYFITSAEQPGLMDRLNRTLKQISMDHPYYTAELYDKYYKKQDGRFQEFTRREMDFIENSSTVSVLVSPDDFPFEWYDEDKKECLGAYVDYLKYLGGLSGLSFDFRPASPRGSLQKQVLQGKAQILLDTINHGDAEHSGLMYTEPFYNCTFSLVGKKDKKLDLSSRQRIAVVARVEGIQEVLEEKYPSWEMVSFETPRECVDAVESGEVDCAMISALKISSDKSLLGENLLMVDGSTADIPVCMGVSMDASPLLTHVLSKMIARAGDGPMDDAVYATILSEQREHRDFNYFIRTYPLYFAAGVVAVSFMGMGIILICYDSRCQKIQNQILQKKNGELEAAIAMQKLLRRKARTDALTGLYNKAASEELCRTIMEKEIGRKCAFMILDLDDFKQINDEQGHQAGDGVLKAIGATLLQCIRQDDVAGRIGGDEFMLFMTGIRDRNQIERSARRIFTALRNNPEFKATCSMGIVLTYTGAMTYERIFQKADAAMYKAKGKGKGKFYIEDFLDEIIIH